MNSDATDGALPPLRVLIVEDSEEDTILLLHDLKRGGFAPSWTRVASAVTLNAALDEQPWDLVIADFSMPGFSGSAALHLVRARDPDVPFIFVSGTIGEDIAVEAMRAGAHDYIMKDNRRRLLPAVRRELREAEVRRAHRRIAARVQQLAYYDVLTNLPNRALLQDRLACALAAAERDSESLALMILDVDGFKDINDTLGHRAGDELLQQLGSRIQQQLREADTVARLGGDEFGILLPATDGTTASVVARRILQAAAKPFQAEALQLTVRASIGIALCPPEGMSADLLMQHADVAMYVAKDTKAGYVVYSAEIDRHSEQRLALSSELGRAIQANELVLHYQPKVHLHTNEVLGLEALARWEHPREGLLPPARFIELAEQTGLIRELTLAVIEMVLRDCRDFTRADRQTSVAVNLSPRTLHDETFAEEIGLMIRAAGLPLHCLELEITENVIIADPARALSTIARLNDMGIRLSIDDFGTGYSSLSYLQRLPVHEIKIDRTFVANMERQGDEMIVRSIIDLAHNLGMVVVAEGVETGAAWDRLVALGCDAAQGFHISRPLPRDAMRSWLQAWPGPRTHPGEGSSGRSSSAQNAPGADPRTNRPPQGENHYPSA